MADIETDRPLEREPLDVLVADVNSTRSRDAVARFEAHVGRLRIGVRENNPEAIDAAIEFLEADPWCFRSGYAKGRLMRHLAQVEPTPDQVARLVNIVLHVVDRGGRPEFRDATRLARKIGGAELRTQLRQRLHGTDTPVARRALFALLDLRRPRLTAEDLAVARRLTLDELRRQSVAPNEYWWQTWPERLAVRLASADWIATLLDEIRTNGPDRHAALLVISCQSTLATSADNFDLLRRVLIDVVRRGGDERGSESMAQLVDSPALRMNLEQLMDDPDRHAQRRAWPARNATRRARNEPANMPPMLLLADSIASATASATT